MRIGATALCKWADTQEEREYYFSFGEYDEVTESDSFGVDDGNIFWYCSEEELIAIGEGNDFQVLEILSYTEKGEDNE